MRLIVGVAVAAMALCATPATGQTRTAGPSASTRATANASERGLRTTNPVLRASLDRIGRGSALWREALAAVADAGRYALVLTPDQVLVADSVGAAEFDAFDRSVLAEAAPVPGPDSQVHVVLVVVNLALLEESHRSRGSLPAEFEVDLDRILVHEIYGHAIPYLLAGHLSGRCADPGRGERASESCSIRRENAVRAELRLGRRTDYGLHGLALTRRDRQ